MGDPRAPIDPSLTTPSTPTLLPFPCEAGEGAAGGWGRSSRAPASTRPHSLHMTLIAAFARPHRSTPVARTRMEPTWAGRPNAGRHPTTACRPAPNPPLAGRAARVQPTRQPQPTGRDATAPHFTSRHLTTPSSRRTPGPSDFPPGRHARHWAPAYAGATGVVVRSDGCRPTHAGTNPARSATSQPRRPGARRDPATFRPVARKALGPGIRRDPATFRPVACGSKHPAYPHPHSRNPHSRPPNRSPHP